MLDTERYDSSSWNMLDQCKSEGVTVEAEATATSAPPNAVAARVGVDSSHQHKENSDAAEQAVSDQCKSEGVTVEAEATATSAPPNAVAARVGVDSRYQHRQNSDAAEQASIEEARIELEIKIIQSVAEKLVEAVTIASGFEKALVDAVAQAVRVHKAEGADGLKKASIAAKPKAPTSPAMAAKDPLPAPTRQFAALSAASLALNAASPDLEDDAAFDETVTPDGPVLKYGRNGVPELRQVICCVVFAACCRVTFCSSRCPRIGGSCVGRAGKDSTAVSMYVKVLMILLNHLFF